MPKAARATAELCAFAGLAYTVLVIDKVAAVREVAARMGMTQDALYGRLRGRSVFRPREVQALIAAVPDQRLIRFFADDSVYIVARRPRPGPQKTTVEAALAETLREAADLMHVVAEAVRDGLPFDHRDIARILTQVKEAETATANLRAAVESRAFPPAGPTAKI
jgi:hypothetical protein